MVELRCPICNEEIVGESENDLSFNLYGHMSQVHEIKDLCKLEGRPGPLEGHGAPITDEDLANYTYAEKSIIESHRPPEERYPGEDIPESVRCPFCREVVRGYASDDFSYNLAMHVRGHGIKVKLMGKG
jgi:cytochrome c-type biogenesis protein CcmH/NrfF